MEFECRASGAAMSSTSTSAGRAGLHVFAGVLIVVVILVERWRAAYFYACDRGGGRFHFPPEVKHELLQPSAAGSGGGTWPITTASSRARTPPA